MKKALLVIMAVLLLTATCWAQEKAAPKDQDVTITGMMSCTFCNLATPSKTCTKQCCQDCIKAGDPPLLTDAKGSLYILLTGEKMKPLMTPERMDLLQGKVTVTGILVKRDGLQGIYVKKMEKAK
jgi:nitrous oxide reductase accessory protein NosL